jgi:hypothetical protein
MTPVPPPESPCVRVGLKYLQSDSFEGGSRFYVAYSGSAPTAADCATLAADIDSEWSLALAGLVNGDWTLVEVDVLDIATDSGFSGQSTTARDGTRSGTPAPSQCASNIEFGIARRYRGGKPRMFLPPGVMGDTVDPGHWDDTFIGELNVGIAAFFAGIEAASIGAMGALSHVNLSYYDGVSTTTPPWRGPGYKYPPKYRAAAVVDPVVGYSAKAMIGSQKRRRASTTY